MGSGDGGGVREGGEVVEVVGVVGVLSENRGDRGEVEDDAEMSRQQVGWWLGY